MSYTQTLYHIVFRTKYSHPCIPQERASLLYNYIWGIIKNKKATLYRINGMEDHIHILSDLPPLIALADYVKDINIASSLWMKKSEFFPLFDGWGEGYCALTYSFKEKERVMHYNKKSTGTS